MQKGFVFDVNRCTGCEACQIACSIENRVDPGVSWRRVYTFNPQRYPGVPTFHHSLACNHCVDPPCMKYCPALAYSKNSDTGAVTIEPDKCIGCKYCSWACPYDAPQFNYSNGTMEKCTFCVHRLESGLEPACVALCPTGALGFEEHQNRVIVKSGDTHDGGDHRIPGFTQTDIGPAIRFVPLRAERKAPVCSTGQRPAVGAEWVNTGGDRIGLRSEWTLAVFTYLAAILVGLYTAGFVASTSGAFEFQLSLSPVVFLLIGGSGVALSTLHLGRRARAWRAALNCRRSWLSREVLLYPAFLVAGTVTLFSDQNGDIVGWLVALVGFAALFSMDRVYHVTRVGGLWSHSAQVFLTGLLFAGLFSANVVLFGLLASVKALLYLRRKYRLAKLGRDSGPWLTRGRVLIGVAVPLAMWSTGSPALYPAIITAVLVGELLDRCEFYGEFDAPAPSKQMASDLAAVVHGLDTKTETDA